MAGRNLFADQPQTKGRNLFAPQVEQPAPPAPDPQAEFDALPTWQKPLQAADDLVRRFANTASFGYADKLAAYMNGTPLEEERAKSEAAGDRAGSAGTVADLAGAVATPAGIAGHGATLAGRLGTAGMKGLMGVGARALAVVPEAAGYGALTAAGNDQDIGTGAALGAVGGGLGSVAGEALGAGVNKLAGAFSKAPNVPTANTIDVLKKAAYQRADDAGVAFTPTGIDRLRQGIVKDFTDHGFLPQNEPGAAAVLKQIEGLQGQNVTVKGLDSIRKMAGNAYDPMNKSNNTLTQVIKRHIDDLIENPSQGDVLMGDSQAGAQAYKEARDLASRGFKLDDVNVALRKADLRAASTGSGGNVDNATRQNLRRVLEKGGKSFSPDETTSLEKVIRGTPVQNALRLGGKLSPSGNGLMAALGVGGAMVNPMIGVASLGGMGAKAVADTLTKKNVNQLVKVIAAGGDASATRAAPNALQRLTQSKRDAIAQALMAIGVNAGSRLQQP